ncbi:MAG: hypothetical protein K0R90_539 [Oscillospiraceae bacterium]|nr:hypothetical protein [Oscillospiraceae bacterium]
MKTHFFKLLSTVLLISILSVSCLSVFAQADVIATATEESTTCKFSFYDSTQTTAIPLWVEQTVIFEKMDWDQSFFKQLKILNYIESYTYNAGSLTSVKINGKEYANTGSQKWQVYINHSQNPSTSFKALSLSDNDLVEWKFVTIVSDPSSASSHQSSSSQQESSSQQVSDTSSYSVNSYTTSSAGTLSSGIVTSQTNFFSSTNSTLTSSKISKTQINPNKYEWNTLLDEALDNACVWLKRSEPGSFHLVALGAAGKSADSKTVNKYVTAIVAQKGSYEHLSGLGRDILTVTLSGMNAADIRGLNLINKLETYPDMSKQGINDIAYALIGIDSNDYVVSDSALNNRESLIKTLINSQSKDGGFSFVVGGESDIDMTAIVLIALSTYRDREDVQPIIQNALNYLSKNQASNGRFPTAYGDSSESISQIIIALNSLGISMEDQRFFKGQKNIVNVLLDFKTPDGGFAHELNGESNLIATEQATLALVSLKNGTSPYKINYLSSDTSSKSSGLSDALGGNNIIIVIVCISIAILLVAAFIIAYFINKKKKELALSPDLITEQSNEDPNSENLE